MTDVIKHITMKDNKLIAEFMGVKPIVLGGSTEYEMYGVLDCIEDGVDEKHFFIDDEMRFQESWDWLMPVVEKIARDEEYFENEFSERLFDIVPFGRIEEVYEVVVEFIKTYNDERQ